MNGTENENENEVRKVVREAKKREQQQQQQQRQEEEGGWEKVGGKGPEAAAEEEEEAGDDFVDKKADPTLLREKMRKKTESERTKASHRSPANGAEEQSEVEEGESTGDLDEMHGEAAAAASDGEAEEEEENEEEQPQNPVTRSAAKGRRGKGKR